MTSDSGVPQITQDSDEPRADRMARLAESHARRLARQRERRQAEVRIDYRPGPDARRVLQHYQELGLPLDAIIDGLILAVGIRPVTGFPETFRKPK